MKNALRAELVARKAHNGQKYGSVPYADGHLKHVVQVLIDFGYDSDMWQTAGWLHDALEDTPYSYSELHEQFGTDITNLVWAVTGVGDTRQQRNTDIYNKIQLYPKAAVLKLADRIANVEQSRKLRFLNMYREEQAEFEPIIRPHVPAPMWERLVKALAGEECEMCGGLKPGGHVQSCKGHIREGSIYQERQEKNR